MEGIWTNDYKIDRDIAGLSEEAANELLTEIDVMVGKNVEAALKEYMAEAEISMCYQPGLFDIELECLSGGTISSKRFDLSEGIKALTAHLDLFDENEKEQKRDIIAGWASKLDAIAAGLRQRLETEK